MVLEDGQDIAIERRRFRGEQAREEGDDVGDGGQSRRLLVYGLRRAAGMMELKLAAEQVERG